MPEPGYDEMETRLIQAVSGNRDPEGGVPLVAMPIPPVVAAAARLARTKLPKDIDVGARLGNFEITGYMCCGGMGAVYRARQVHTRVQAALKVVFRGSGEEAALRQEARRLAEVQLANVIKFLDGGENDDYVWFATHYVNGPTLAEYCQHRNAGGGDSDVFLNFESSSQISSQRGSKSLLGLRSKCPTPPTAADLRCWMRWWRDLASPRTSAHFDFGVVTRRIAVEAYRVCSTLKSVGFH